MEENEEDVSFTSDAIIGGVTMAAQYPEAATIEGKDGTVPSGLVSHCSATLISPKVILTAGHCVDGPASWKVTVGAQSRTTTRAATFDWKNESGFNAAHHDVGLLFLDKAITLSSYPTIATAAVATSAQLMNVGRVHNGLTSTLWGAITTGVTYGAPHNCPFLYITDRVIEGGDSGGPDFLAGTHTIVAVNSVTFAGANLQGLARVDQINAWITRPLNDSAFFIRQTYLDVLKREPDVGGSNFFMNSLQSCNGNAACVASGRVAVARGLLESNENRTQDPDLNPASASYKSAFITHCYTNFLQRQPDAAGYNYWLSFLNSTSDYNTVISNFITSPEYLQRFNSL